MKTKDKLVIGGHEFDSRFILGSGKYSMKLIEAAVRDAGAQIITLAVRRANTKDHENILDYIPEGVTLLPNTSGARNAQEAVRIARLARELGCGNFVKVEIMRDSKYLLPDNQETIKATEILAKEGFVVMPYMYPDLNAARDLVNAGAACVMPLASPIGSNKGLATKEFIQILIDEIDLPAETMKQILSGTFGAVLFSALVLLPAVFIGNPQILLIITTKVFVSVTLIGILSAGTSWNKLTASLRSFHIPDIFIFTLDITLKYIAVLGEICMEILTSLRLRSVGQNRKKAQSFSGILGISFLKSREMAEEMYAAMCCRGFVGEYKTQKTSTFRKQDILSLLLMIGVTGIFIYFEGLWK